MEIDSTQKENYVQAPTTNLNVERDETRELRSTVKEYEARIKELEAYKHDKEAKSERETLFKELMFDQTDQEIATNLLTKYKVKDQKGFITDFYNSIIKPRSIDAKADRLYSQHHTSKATSNIMEDFSKVFSTKK